MYNIVWVICTSADGLKNWVKFAASILYIFAVHTDTNLISVPATQYAYINASASLKYASEYAIDNIIWVGPNSKVHNGTIEHVTLESEGRHNCTMTIMGAPKDWPVDVFVIG